MTAINYSELRSSLKDMMDKVCDDHEPITVHRRDSSNVVMMSLEDYESMQETAYLLRSPNNANRILESINSFKSSQGTEKELIGDSE